ncbi:MAG TPA: hypothetical protein VGV61_19540 [Thermoanaerobaculia bacterium]|nr:hypothetical protein [Thermoanaerobaculia bacterium]
MTLLHNPAAVLAWNTDKRYLRELAAAGVIVVPTTFLAPGEPPVLPASTELVVKPAVSAGSNDTARYDAAGGAAARAHVQRLHAEGRMVMVQPYQRAVDEYGETALVYFDGELSHSIEKGSIFAARPEIVGGLFAREEIRPRTPSPSLWSPSSARARSTRPRSACGRCSSRTTAGNLAPSSTRCTPSSASTPRRRPPWRSSS